MTEITPWLVWSVPFVGALLTPIFAKVHDKVRDYAAVAFSFVSVALASTLLPSALKGEIIHSQIPWITPKPLDIKAGVLADPLSIIMANVVGWISFLIMIYSLDYMKGEAGLVRYWFLMNFFIGSMQLIVLSDNLLQLFFGWEGVGFASYALIGFWHTDEKKYWVGTPGKEAWGVPLAYAPSHAGMKAFITTRIGDISFLIGLLILYHFSHTFEFLKLAEDKAWAKGLADSGLLVPVAVLIFGGAIGKSAQFPLHEWLPDAMAGPTSVSALIHAATMVKAGVFLIARVGPSFYSAAVATQQITPFFETVAWIGAFTAFLAASQALVSKEIKKVLAYSTVSQIGYMMLSMGAAGLAANFISGYTSGFFHLMSHAIFKGALFMGAGALLHATETKYMDEMGGIRRRMRITFVTMLIAASSLSGIPPFSGFWSKDAVLASILRMESLSTIPLFFLAVGTAFITAFYSFRMIGMVFFGGKSRHLEELEKEGHEVHESSPLMWIPYSLLALATIGVGVVGPLFESGLEKVLGSYLHELYKMPEVEAPGLNFLALGASLSAVVVGGSLSYLFYMARKVDPGLVLAKNSILGGLYKFLENRWYLNSLYYLVFVNGFEKASRAVFRFLETGVIDRSNTISAKGSVGLSKLSDTFDVHVVDGLVNGAKEASALFSQATRKIQTGVTENYVLAFAAGIVAIIFFMFVV